ncbi:uncharacterized protein EDB91DRAFT_1064438 [Suillus paluster]|uniref:uncharacterized protein n=1 Tax=Suillus paluster TaxID=48578 RepID=UPI001B869B52|nr:uncharacterized protein EDB91DRAFT_1064438 [Suillus paluster]KAG1721362.1 hypothetical protein EDB91DRAFT_1064438 [Suillus paluster]
MVNTRIYIFPTSSVSHNLASLLIFADIYTKTAELHLWCRLYSSSWSKPCQVTMLTQCSDHSRSGKRFPVPKSLLDCATVQPYVHNCFVTLHEGRHIYQFCGFFKWHCRLRANPLLSSIDHIFRGDAVVMRIGAGASSVVNMRGRDNSLADFIMHW